MSVIVEGMKMPKNCKECVIEQVDEDCIHYWCPLLQKNTNNYYRRRLSHCPLVELPSHGRLIDADAALRDGWTINRTYSKSPTVTVYEVKAIDDLPIIVPADVYDNNVENIEVEEVSK